MEKDFQRWTAKRKVELLLQLIRGETKLVDACREHDLKQSEVEAWMESLPARAASASLKARSEDEQAVHERELRELRAKVGELVAGARRAKKTGRPHRETRESLLTVQGLMRAEGRTVSIAKLCRWFGVPRSTFYYRPPVPAAPRVPVIDEALASADPGHHRRRAASSGLRMITARVRRTAAAPVNPQEDPSDPEAQRLAGPAAAAGPPPARPGLDLPRRSAVHARTERRDRAFLPDAQARVRVASAFPESRPRLPRDRRLSIATRRTPYSPPISPREIREKLAA